MKAISPSLAKKRRVLRTGLMATAMMKTMRMKMIKMKVTLIWPVRQAMKRSWKRLLVKQGRFTSYQQRRMIWAVLPLSRYGLYGY